MATARFEVLTQSEVERIHAASMEILSAVGIEVDYQTARDLFRQAGAEMDDDAQCVRIPEELVQWAVEQAPARFTLYGSAADFQMEIGGGQTHFAALGTPTSIIDADTGERRPTTMSDVVRHIQLVNGCQLIHNSQMDEGQKMRIGEWMGEGIVRASVGLENVQDLIVDLDQALRGRTFKGLVGPAAYALLKRLG